MFQYYGPVCVPSSRCKPGAFFFFMLFILGFVLLSLRGRVGSSSVSHKNQFWVWKEACLTCPESGTAALDYALPWVRQKIWPFMIWWLEILIAVRSCFVSERRLSDKPDGGWRQMDEKLEPDLMLERCAFSQRWGLPERSIVFLCCMAFILHNHRENIFAMVMGNNL